MKAKTNSTGLKLLENINLSLKFYFAKNFVLLKFADMNDLNDEFMHQSCLQVNILFFCYRLVILFKEEKILIHAVYLLLSLIFLQFALGVSTLLLVVPLSFALLHQLCGILLLMASIYVLHSIRGIKESMNARL